MKKYSIIVPIFNEEKNIKKFFLKFEKFKDNFLSENFELVIVNDGSTDHSKNIILEWSERNMKLNHKIIHNQINSGYGNALKKGILNSKFENIIIIDCDQTYKFSDVEILIDKFELEEIDMIVGSIIKSIKERGK